jgi:DNA-3-methyladenine glycosylase II
MPPRRLDRAALAEGTRALARCDPDLGRLHARLGVPPMWGRQPGFAALVRIILEQQVSLDAARTLFRRLAAHAGAMTPAALHALGVDGLRAFGLTRQKAAYCHGLATRILDGELALARVAAAPDEQGRAMLRAVPGIGPWSVDIYYLMALRRPDVWPQGDLALAVALREVKQLNALPDRDAQQAIAAAWAPWRSVAARLLWAHYLDARGKYATAQ